MAPPTRQERLQMRQRGAGARKVNNVNFGFSFGLTPANVERSFSRTPRSSIASRRRPSKTPSRSRRQSSAQPSIRSTSATTNGHQYVPNQPIDRPEDKNTHTEEPTAKRRKTKDISASESIAPGDHIPPFFASAGASSQIVYRNPKPRRRTSGPVFVQIAEDSEDKVVSEQLLDNTALLKEPIQTAPEPEIGVTTVDKENAVPNEEFGKENSFTGGTQKRKPKKRRSIGQQSGRRKTRLSDASVQSIAQEPPPDEAARESVNEEPEWETMVGDDSGLLLEEISRTTAPNGTTGKKRRKRKSVVLKPRKRGRSGDSHMQSVPSTPEVAHDMDASVGDMVEQSIGTEPTPNIQARNAARRSFSNGYDTETSPNRHAYEPEVEGDETYADEASPEKPTPKAPSKKGKTKGRKGCQTGSSVRSSLSGSAGASSRLEKSSKTTFPILTHRMTNLSALPTITEEGDDDLESTANPNSLMAKFADRSAPNAIDVLAQICRESISITISKLSATSGTASIREMKRKRSALEAFSSEIDSRLFDMSVAVEHRLTMETRVKKARRAKTDAQNEWVAIRREREEIALKCDDIRARNRIMEAQSKETYELSERLHELEMLVEKPELEGERSASDGLEYMLRSVATTVSGTTGVGNGLLARVKDYNRQLERTALVLEGRELD